MPLLGYNSWQNFEKAIDRAKISCEESGDEVSQCFIDAIKTLEMPKGGKKELKDYHLTRFACYLIAQNGDPRKSEIANAQAYFAVSTRAHEIEQLRLAQKQRLEKCLKVSESYKLLASVATNAGVENEHMGIFMDAGNLGLYEHTLEELKEKKGVSENEENPNRTCTKVIC
jgi:DNA-damage-inducible protein D